MSAASQQMYDTGFLVIPSSDTNTFHFGTETISTISSAGITSRSAAVPMNSSVKGYLAGGLIGGIGTSLIDGLKFADGSSFVAASTLGRSQYGGHGVSSVVKGYVAGGDSSGYVQTIDAMAFNNETRTTLAVDLTGTVTRDSGGFSNFTHGYITALNFQYVDKLAFATETLTSLGTLQVGSGTLDTASLNSLTAGYVLGCSNVGSARIDKLLFSSDTASILSATLSIARGARDGTLNTSAKGYVCGGQNANASSTSYTEIDGVLFSTDTAINPSAAITVATNGAVGLQGGWL